MPSSKTLLTVSEVVARFRVAKVGKDDKSRRSYVDELMRKGVLREQYELPAGRTRAGRNDPRITKRSVDKFLAKLEALDGETSVVVLVARVGQLMDDIDRASRVAQQQLLVETEAHRKTAHEKVDAEFDAKELQARLELATADASREAATRRSLEHVIMQDQGPQGSQDFE